MLQPARGSRALFPCLLSPNLAYPVRPRRRHGCLDPTSLEKHGYRARAAVTTLLHGQAGYGARGGATRPVSRGDRGGRHAIYI